MDCPYWNLASGYGWSVAWWCATVACESEFRPWVISPYGHAGLMQVDGGSTDPVTNIAQGWAKYVNWQNGIVANPWPYCGWLVAT